MAKQKDGGHKEKPKIPRDTEAEEQQELKKQTE